MHQPSSSTNKTDTPTNVLDIQTFTIQPSQGLKVLLGTFCAGSEPQFRAIYHDHSLESPNVVSHHDIELPRKGGTYQLYRHFESYSQVPHSITVRFASEADKELRLAD